jgi:hypothetical protein
MNVERWGGKAFLPTYFDETRNGILIFLLPPRTGSNSPSSHQAIHMSKTHVGDPEEGRLYAVDSLDFFDEELISILAAASQFAYDCFLEPDEFEYPRAAPAFQLLKKDTVEGIGYAFLRIQYGEKHANKVMYSDDSGEILTAFNSCGEKAKIQTGFCNGAFLGRNTG